MRTGIGVLVVAFAVSATGCVSDVIGERLEGSGTIVEGGYDIGAFDEVHVSSNFEVVFTVATEPSLVVRADDNVVDVVEVVVDDGALLIGLESRVRVSNATLEAEIAGPVPRVMTVSGAASLTASDSLEADAVALAASGSADLDVVVDVDDLVVDASGDSRAAVSGQARTVVATASGASDIVAGGLRIGVLEVSLSGSSHMTCRVDDRITAVASGSSHLRYSGGARVVSENVTGASTVGPVHTDDPRR